MAEALRRVAGSYAGPGYWFAPTLESATTSLRDQSLSWENLRTICSSHRLVVGHFRAQAFLEAGCVSLAFQVREPRSRLLSLYRYWRSLDPHTLRAWGTRGTQIVVATGGGLESLLDSPGLADDVYNSIALQLLGASQRLSTRSDLRRLGSSRYTHHAYERLLGRIAVSEWSSDSQRFVDRVCTEVLGVPPVHVGMANETTPGDPEKIGRRCRRQLEESTEDDRLLLQRLADDGFLPPRSSAELDAEFEETCRRLSFLL